MAASARANYAFDEVMVMSGASEQACSFCFETVSQTKCPLAASRFALCSSGRHLACRPCALSALRLSLEPDRGPALAHCVLCISPQSSKAPSASSSAAAAASSGGAASSSASSGAASSSAAASGGAASSYAAASGAAFSAASLPPADTLRLLQLSPFRLSEDWAVRQQCIRLLARAQAVNYQARQRDSLFFFLPQDSASFASRLYSVACIERNLTRKETSYFFASGQSKSACQELANDFAQLYLDYSVYNASFMLSRAFKNHLSFAPPSSASASASAYALDSARVLKITQDFATECEAQLSAAKSAVEALRVQADAASAALKDLKPPTRKRGRRTLEALEENIEQGLGWLELQTQVNDSLRALLDARHAQKRAALRVRLSKEELSRGLILHRACKESPAVASSLSVIARVFQEYGAAAEARPLSATEDMRITEVVTSLTLKLDRCPYGDCDKLFSKDPFDSTCPHCYRLPIPPCPACNAKPHPGKTCAAARGDAAALPDSVKCANPACQASYTKVRNDGCHYLTCVSPTCRTVSLRPVLPRSNRARAHVHDMANASSRHFTSFCLFNNSQILL